MNVTRLKGPRKQGAHGEHSGLHVQVGKVATWFLQKAPQRSVAIMECTEMDKVDQVHFDAVFGRPPYLLGAEAWAPIRRHRLWWHSHEPVFPPGTVQRQKED